MKAEKLTKKQRNEIYKKALAILNHSYIFVCCAIREASRYPHNELSSQFENEFKELFLFKDLNRPAWLTRGDDTRYRTDDGRELRKCVLEFCIAMTE